MTSREIAAMRALSKAPNGIKAIGIKTARELIGLGYVREASVSPLPKRGVFVVLTTRGKSWVARNI